MKSATPRRQKSKPGILGIYYRDVKPERGVTLPAPSDFRRSDALAPKIAYT